MAHLADARGDPFADGQVRAAGQRARQDEVRARERLGRAGQQRRLRRDGRLRPGLRRLEQSVVLVGDRDLVGGLLIVTVAGVDQAEARAPSGAGSVIV